MTRVQWAHRLTWASYGLLLAQQALDAWLLGLPFVIWLFKLVPALVFLPGMLRDRLRSYIWVCFVSLGYFVVLVQRIFADPGSLVVAAGLVAVVVLFLAAMLYVRWRAREQADRQAPTEADT